MDLETIKELIKSMESGGLTKISLKDKDGFEIELEKKTALQATFCPPSLPTLPPAVESALPTKSAGPESPQEEGGFDVTSPMVGTFYTASSPDAAPFVKVGDSVTEDTVIGIIEAMKVMNEIKAGKIGTVAEVFVDNAHPVEFGTKILRLA